LISKFRRTPRFFSLRFLPSLFFPPPILSPFLPPRAQTAQNPFHRVRHGRIFLSPSFRFLFSSLSSLLRAVFLPTPVSTRDYFSVGKLSAYNSPLSLPLSCHLHAFPSVFRSCEGTPPIRLSRTTPLPLLRDNSMKGLWAPVFMAPPSPFPMPRSRQSVCLCIHRKIFPFFLLTRKRWSSASPRCFGSTSATFFSFVVLGSNLVSPFRGLKQLFYGSLSASLAVPLLPPPLPSYGDVLLASPNERAL